ncbi:MAG TPA: hypothetical protein G4N95_06185 [Anaerolineae bacterium]|nr:hypothetical protein [Anaerolineae bacterium]
MRGRTPLHAWIGLGLVVIFWGLNWVYPGLRTHWCFFFLWLGYCLVVDGLVFIRKGTSLLTRNPKAYAGLFIASVPGWWLFELINLRVQNWEYLGAEAFDPIQYLLLTSLSFSTVMPAVFGTAELASTFPWLKRKRLGWRIKPDRRTTLIFFAAGWIMLGLLLLYPRIFFPFVWLSVYFIFEPINIWLGHRSLADYTAKGDWSPMYALWTGVIITGFFWEMWNYYAFPKWVYHVPYVDFLHIFEMPILGYGGYLPFSMELFALYHLLIGLLKADWLRDYVQIAPQTPEQKTKTAS